MRTNNPIADFHRHDAEQEEWRKRLPKCNACGKHIDDYIYAIDGGICQECLNERYREEVEI